MRHFLIGALSALVSSAVLAGEGVMQRIDMAATGDHRSDANIARNRYRHPVATLDFFGLEDGMRVLEIWPGGGWYTEVLAPAVRGHGEFVVANWDPDVPEQPDYRYRLPREMHEKFALRPELYDQVQEVHWSPPQSASLGDANSYDMILTFRNTHGWVGNGIAQDVFNEFARVLKPGGALGVVQHRAAEGADPEASAEFGYLPEAHVKALAAQAGLVFEASSQVNANPKDSRDHPEGVWTLPPGLRLGEKDLDKYLAIGESDRMTLRFRKPAQ